MIAQYTNRRISPGSPEPLGASINHGGVNFSVASHFATAVYLLLFNNPDDGEPTDIIHMNRDDYGVWHIFVHGIKAGHLYGYKVDGDYNPREGKRFNRNKLLIDPYAKAVSGKCNHNDGLLFAYDIKSEEEDLSFDNRDNSKQMAKSIIVDNEFDWQDDSLPRIPESDTIIFETHLKGFTAHPSSGVKHPGTYKGFIEKIPYLKELGITTVELMPIQEHHVQQFVLDRGLTNYWGYDTLAYFAPEVTYCNKQYSGCQVTEFKTLVRELHKAGLEIILDVVYNHTPEGNHLGPTLSLKGVDNLTYYRLTGDNDIESMRYYFDQTGTGNTLNAENPQCLRLIIDSLRYWVSIMHVDGFRFDLASALGNLNGTFDPNAPFFRAISEDPLLRKVKLIAEPWDMTQYQVGNFPPGWLEWNGNYRDTGRRFIKGDDNQAAEFARSISGSSGLFQKEGRKSVESINFITAHDGFTLYDIFSYNEKHNESNKENNNDGANDNNSWNCGTEGDTADRHILLLRKKLIKNSLLTLMISRGTPMVYGGDEFMRTQNGNNNAWCQDNEISWYNWELVHKNRDVFEFFKKAVSLRKQYGPLHENEFLTGRSQSAGGMADILWYDKNLSDPRWDYPKLKTLCFLLYNAALQGEDNVHFLYFVFNMHFRSVYVHLPPIKNMKWYRVIDTSRKAGQDFLAHGKEKVLRNQKRQRCNARSCSLFITKSHSPLASIILQKFDPFNL
ncbi:MAG: glycogen debranching protein GlgX [Chitinivibrionales bacterium]|nr:glycogen debranching protein GlgX [Chitinivibrionales bacterium]